MVACIASAGTPPFLGGKLLITHLGEDYVSRMFTTYAGRVPAEADLVCYWFEKAGRQIASGKAARVGLVATNSGWTLAVFVILVLQMSCAVSAVRWIFGF